MALVTIPGGGLRLFPFIASTGIAANVQFELNASNERCAFVFRAPRTGNIHSLSFHVGSSVSVVDQHTVSLQTVSTTTGLPTGTLVGTNTSATVLLDSTGYKTVTLTADAAVTKGDLIAIVVAAPAANFGSIRLSGHTASSRSFPYIVNAVNGKSTICPIAAVEYDDNTVDAIDGFFPQTSEATVAFHSGSNPNRRGLRFQIPFAARLSGISIQADFDTPLADIVFYDSDGVTATTVYSMDTDLRGNANENLLELAFATPIELDADTYYRIVVVPTSATTMGLRTLTVTAAKFMDGLAGGQDMHYTTANGTPAAEGDWTNDTVTRPFISLWFDQVDDGAGGGGGSGSEVSHVFIG